MFYIFSFPLDAYVGTHASITCPSILTLLVTQLGRKFGSYAVDSETNSYYVRRVFELCRICNYLTDIVFN